MTMAGWDVVVIISFKAETRLEFFRVISYWDGSTLYNSHTIPDYANGHWLVYNIRVESMEL